ncbi:MAG: hypothetical protein LC733_12595 [Actinobacteria bacterium]|nr:hypothetical protein [Actinomycetota bacterium]
MELPLSYRVNALLYLLGGLAFFLPSTTVTTTAVTTTVARAAVAAAANPGGGGGRTTPATDPPDDGSQTTDPPQTEETLPPIVIVCRDSVDNRCGDFFWDPAPPANRPTEIDVRPLSATAGRQVAFTVTVTEPDRATDAACVSVDFGDRVTSPPCEPPCPSRFGPWTPAGPGVRSSKAFPFTHTYAEARAYTMTLTIDTRSDCNDPFGEKTIVTRSVQVVGPPASG